MFSQELKRVGTSPDEAGAEVIIYANEYDEIIDKCKSAAKFVLALLKEEIENDEKLGASADDFKFSEIFQNSTIGVSAHITVDIIDFNENVLPPLTLNYFGTFFMQKFNEKHMNEISKKIGRRFTVRMHRNMFKDNITIALVSYNPYLVRKGAKSDSSFDAKEFIKRTRGEESLKYEDFNDIGTEGFIKDIFNKIIGKKKEDSKPTKKMVQMTKSEFGDKINNVTDDILADINKVFKDVKLKYKDFFLNNCGDAIKVATKDNILEDIDQKYMVLFEFDMWEVTGKAGKGRAGTLAKDDLEAFEAYYNVMNDLENGSKMIINKYFSDWIAKGVIMNVEYGGDWDDGPITLDFDNIQIMEESTEALKDIVKKVAKKAADKAGIIPAGTIDINKKNIKDFARACSILEKYGKTGDIMTRSFKGLDFNRFGGKGTMDAFLNSFRPVGDFHVAQGWLIFDLLETKTHALKNNLDKEGWDFVYDAADMVTKKANYVAVKTIKDLFKGRGIEVHPNPIGHLLSKNGTKARLMYKIGKVNIEDGVYSADELVSRLRSTVGAESFEFRANVFDIDEFELAVEDVMNDYDFYESIGIESDMIAIADTFGEIDEIEEMIAIESVNMNYLDSFEAMEDEINSILTEISSLEVALESYEEGTEGFKEVADSLVQAGKKLIKAILKYFNIGLTLNEQGHKTSKIIGKIARKTIVELKQLPREAQEKFEFVTASLSLTQWYMNRYYSNDNKSSPFVVMAERINRTYNSQGRKFTEANIREFAYQLEVLKATFTKPQEIADMSIVKPKMDYDETVDAFGQLLGARGEHAFRKCTGDVEQVIKILSTETNNLEYSSSMIESLKNWLKQLQDCVQPFKKSIINLGKAVKGLTRDIKKAIVKSKKDAGIESYYGFESSIAKTDNTDAIVQEILNRMENDPILKLAKDKELIIIKKNPESKRKIAINFKEIRDIEKVLTPEDIQSYGGSTYQFLLKLSDTFNKNIMWKMKEIEETAKSGGSMDSELDAIESSQLRGREYLLAVGAETVEDLIDEMLADEIGNEDLAEIGESLLNHIKRIIAKVIDYLGKERWIYRAQVKTFKTIKTKINALGKDNYQDYDLTKVSMALSALAFISKRKHSFYRSLMKIKLDDADELRDAMQGLRSHQKGLEKAVENLQKASAIINGGSYSKGASSMGSLNTIKSTLSKIKMEWVPVKENLVKLQRRLNQNENPMDEKLLKGVQGFITIASQLQRQYLKGVNDALNICSKLLKDVKPANEGVEVEVFCGNESVMVGSTEGIKDEIEGILISTLAIAGTIGIMVGAKKLWEKTPWGKKQLEAKIKREIELQEQEKKIANQRLQEKQEQETRQLTKETYKELSNKALPVIENISKNVSKMIPKMSEFKVFTKEVNEKAKTDEFVKDVKNDILWMSADNVEAYDFGISAFDFSQDVYLIDAWRGLSEATLDEMNKQAHKIPCKPGYKWIFTQPFDDESCFWCVLQYTGNGGGNESVEDEVYCDVIAFEDADDYYKDPAHYKGSFSDAIKIVKNGIVAFLKPFTPSARREALRKKQEEQERLDREREEAARKKEQYEKDHAEMSKLYDQYINKALPVAKKEAEKIVKMIPNFPNFKALVKEVSDYGKKHNWQNATDCISYYVDGDTRCADYETVIISYDQDLMGFDNHDRIEETIINRLDKIADKIPHPEGWRWYFEGPYDDEACIWMGLTKIEAGTEALSTSDKLTFASLVAGTVGLFVWSYKADKKSKAEQAKIKAELQRRDIEQNLRDNGTEIPKEIRSQVVDACSKAAQEILSKAQNNANIKMVSKPLPNGFFIDNISDLTEDSIGYVVSIPHISEDRLSKLEKYMSSIDDMIVDTIHKHIDKINIPDERFTLRVEFNENNLYIVRYVLKKDASYESVGNEGFFSDLKQRWKDGVEKQKARRAKEQEGRTKKQFESIKDGAIKVFSSKAEFDKFVANSEKVVKLIYNEIKKNVSSSKLNYIQISPFEDLEDAVNINSDYDPKLQLEFHFVHYSTPEWTKENHEDVFEQEEKLQDIIEATINKYKSKFGVPIEYYGIDGNLSWGTTDGYLVIDEKSEGSTESHKLVEAIYDEFGLEGLTNLVSKIIKNK